LLQWLCCRHSIKHNQGNEMGQAMRAATTRDAPWGLLDPHQAQSALGALAPTLAVGLVVLGDDGRVAFCNQAATHMLGHPAPALLGQPLPTVGNGPWCPTQPTQPDATQHLQLLRANGQRVLLAASVSELALRGGRWLLALHDISHEAAAQDRLAAQAAYFAQRNVHLALLQRPTLDIAAQPDLPTTLHTIAYRAARLVEADGSAILLLEDQTLHVASVWGSGERYASAAGQVCSGVAARALTSGRAQRVYGEPLLAGDTTKGALLAIPMHYHSTVTGLVAVLRDKAELPFSEDDELLLGAIASQAALAIGNAKLYETTRDSLAQLETMTVLLEAINAQRELQPLLDRIIDGATRLFAVEVGVISLWDEAQHLARIVASRDLPELVGIAVAPGGLGVTGQVLERGEPVIVNDHYRQLPGSELLHVAIDHALGAPIKWQERMVGVFMVGSHTRRFTEHDLGPLTLFAKHAAIAIEKARLFDEAHALAQALRRSETRLRAIIDNMPALVYLADVEQGMLLANQQFAEFLGLPSPEALLGKRADELFPPEEAHTIRANNAPVFERGAKVVVEETAVRDGETRHFLSIKFPVREAGTPRLALGGVSVDITERKQNEERLRQLAALEERARLARELHDSVTQTLFSMALNARAAERALHNNPEQAASTVAELRRLAQGALAEMRALIFELRPESLQNEGLLAAVAKHTAALEARHELHVTLDTDHEPNIDIDTKAALYRIAQEAMHNVVKHAHATHVVVVLRHVGADFVLQVRDDGRGFDPQRNFPGHLGLVSMRERAERLGARFAIESAPGQGTTVTVQLRV
jgi:PAS domain S-box-containing protein